MLCKDCFSVGVESNFEWTTKNVRPADAITANQLLLMEEWTADEEVRLIEGLLKAPPPPTPPPPTHPPSPHPTPPHFTHPPHPIPPHPTPPSPHTPTPFIAAPNISPPTRTDAASYKAPARPSTHTIQQYGFGNWQSISAHLSGTKYDRLCEKHYIRFYLRQDTYPLPDFLLPPIALGSCRVDERSRHREPTFQQAEVASKGECARCTSLPLRVHVRTLFRSLVGWN